MLELTQRLKESRTKGRPDSKLRELKKKASDLEVEMEEWHDYYDMTGLEQKAEELDEVKHESANEEILENKRAIQESSQ